jgi:hypothetical protein
MYVCVCVQRLKLQQKFVTWAKNDKVTKEQCKDGT